MTSLAQTWSVLPYSNFIPTSHTSDITLDRAKLIYGIIMKMDMNLGYLISHQISIIAQHDSSRLGFPALIVALCKARGVAPDSKSLESLSPAINLAYIKKNCWNLDDPTVAFRGPRKARGKRSEASPTSAAPDTSAPSSSTLPDPLAPSTSTPHLPQFPVQLPASFAPASDLLFTPEMLHSMMQSLHRGQVAWPRVQPSPSGGGGASAAQEPDSTELVEELTEEQAVEEPVLAEDELTPFEPFSFATDTSMAQEEETSPDPMPEPFPTPISEDTMPSAPAMEPEQPILQDILAVPVLDLKEDEPQDEQDV
ncbi:hypothetical protein GmHk_19G054840 [Glycine max]|nr:hypothetical protein GmHk_19G054840 [Glycine max]